MRHVLALAVGMSILAATPLVRAQDAPPSPERIKAAAEEFDRGRRAYLAKDYGQAAVHFENAFRDAPRAETLRLAIRARRDAKDPARAATLAAVAQERYPNDAPTTAMAKETLDAAAPQLQEYVITCSIECAIAADGRVVSQADGLKHRIFLDPGAHDLGVSFRKGESVSKHVEAKKGASENIMFEPAPDKPLDKPLDKPVDKPIDKPAPPPPEKPLGPVVFFIAAGVTIAAGAATIVSGIDAQNNPGKEAVRRECAGKDESCTLYQEGQSAELRTNILLGATIGVAVVTGVIGLFFTQWSSDKKTGIHLLPNGVRF